MDQTFQPLTPEQFQKAQQAGFSTDQIIQNEQIRKSQSQISQQSIPQNTLTGQDNPIGSLPVIKQLTQVGAGIGSAIGKAGLNLGKAVVGLPQQIADIGTKVMGAPQQNYGFLNNVKQNLDVISNKLYQEPVQNELNTVGGQIGNVIGQVAPYFTGIGETTAGLSNAASGANILKGTGILPAVGRTLAGAGTEGLANYGAGYALSGGDTNQALTQGLTAGLLKGGTSGLGEAGIGTKLPQRLMSNVYKTDKNTVANIFNEAGTATEGKTQPLSQWALDKGLKGSLESQALKVKTILNQSENKVIANADASKVRIPVASNLFKMAQGIMKDFQNVGRGEIAAKADQFLRAVKNNSVSVRDAINFRRLIDNTLRTKSSFNNPALADNLAYWAEDLRKAINNADGIGAINKDYSQAIKAREALIKAATARNNQRALGALESYALGGGILAGEPISGVAIVGAKRALQSPTITSNIAQGIKNLPQSSTTGATARSVIGQLLGKLNPATQQDNNMPQ